MENNKTTKVMLEGRVQGVGMRHFISTSAHNFNLTGYVKNKIDGSVECVFQGQEKVITSFITYIKKNAPGLIANLSKEEVNDDQSYDYFNVTS